MKTLSKFREKLIALFGSVVISLGCFSSPAVAQLEGVPVLGDLTSLIDAGGLGGTITSLTATIELGQITTLTEDAGFNGLFFSNGGLDGVLDLVLDIGSGILGGGGIGAVPLIGSDLDILASVDGFQAGITGLLVDQELPIGLPVVGRTPHKLYAPVVMTLLNTQGIPVL